MPKKRIDRTGEVYGHLELTGRISRRDDRGKLVTFYQFICRSEGVERRNCKGSGEIRASNLGPKTLSCGCVRGRAVDPSPEKSDREKPIEERFSAAFLADVTSFWKVGELRPTFTRNEEEKDGWRKLNRRSASDVMCRFNVSYQDATDLVRWLDPDRIAARKRAEAAKRRADAVWAENRRHDMHFVDGGLICSPECKECADSVAARDAGAPNLRRSRVVDLTFYSFLKETGPLDSDFVAKRRREAWLKTRTN